MSNEKETLETEYTYTRNSTWETYDGRKSPIKDLEDTHILNLVNFMSRRVKKAEESVKEEIDKIDSIDLIINMRKKRLSKNQQVLKVILEEVELRNLDLTKIASGKSLPFKKDGRWWQWKEGDPRPTPIPNSIDFIKPLDGSEDDV